MSAIQGLNAAAIDAWLGKLAEGPVGVLPDSLFMEIEGLKSPDWSFTTALVLSFLDTSRYDRSVRSLVRERVVQLVTDTEKKAEHPVVKVVMAQSIFALPQLPTVDQCVNLYSKVQRWKKLLSTGSLPAAAALSGHPYEKDFALFERYTGEARSIQKIFDDHRENISTEINGEEGVEARDEYLTILTMIRDLFGSHFSASTNRVLEQLRRAVRAGRLTSRQQVFLNGIKSYWNHLLTTSWPLDNHLHLLRHVLDYSESAPTTDPDSVLRANIAEELNRAIRRNSPS